MDLENKKIIKTSCTQPELYRLHFKSCVWFFKLYFEFVTSERDILRHMSNMLISRYSLYNVNYMYIKIFVYMCCIFKL